MLAAGRGDWSPAETFIGGLSSLGADGGRSSQAGSVNAVAWISWETS